MTRTNRRPARTCCRSAAIVWAGLLWLSAPASAGNVVFLAATPQAGPSTELTVQQGDPITLYVRMQFDDTTVGGGISLVYDAGLLRVDDVAFDAALGDDESLRCPAAAGPAPACPAGTDLVSFGNLTGLAGDRSVARLDLTAIGNGTSPIGASAALPFSDVTGRLLDVSFVPEPGGSLPLAAAATLLAMLGRRRLTRPSATSARPRQQRRARAARARVRRAGT